MSHHRSLGDGGAARAVPQTSGVRGCYRKGAGARQDPTDPTVHHGLPGLVNIEKTMGNHHVEWENSLFLWPFSIAMVNYQRVL